MQFSDIETLLSLYFRYAQCLITTLMIVRILCAIYKNSSVTGSTEISRRSAIDTNDTKLTPQQSDSVLNQLPWICIWQAGCLYKQN